jgi:hypothetical protein
MRKRNESSPVKIVRLGLVLLVLAAGVATVAGGCGNDRPGVGGDPGVTPAEGPCADGLTRGCKLKVSEQNGIITCAQGTEECIRGRWTGCNASNVTVSSWAGTLTDPTGLGALPTLAGPSADASACTANPCNANCLGFSNNCGINIGLSQPYVTSTSPIGSVAALPLTHRANPLICGTMTEFCNHGFKCESNILPVCTPYAPGDSFGGAGKYDWSIDQPCWDGTRWVLSVCNRSGKDTPASVNIYASSATPTGVVGIGFPTGPGGGSLYTFNTGVVPAGTCKNLNASLTGATASGTWWFYVNPPNDLTFANTGFTANELESNNNYAAYEHADRNNPSNACRLASNPGAIALSDAGIADGGACPATSVGVLQSGTTFGNAPGGFAGKSSCSPCSSGFPKDCTGENHYNRYDACLADTYCNQGVDLKVPTPVDNCVRFQNGETYGACAVGDGFDVTVGASCNAGPLGDVFPVCNRGKDPIPAGTYLAADISVGGAAFGVGACPAASTPDCSTRLTSALAPGECINMGPATGCNWGNSNSVVQVSARTTANGAALPECTKGGVDTGCGNNWADIKAGAVCNSIGLPTTFTTQVTATCTDPSTRPRWLALTVDAITLCIGPSCPSISFDAKATGATYDGALTSGPTVRVGNFSSGTVMAPAYPPTCPASGPLPCPADLRGVLDSAGGTTPSGSYLETLDITVTFNPGLVPPVLNNWSVTYQCLPVE